MRNRGLILACLCLLPHCARKNEDQATTASLPQREVLDPSVYTMTAYVFSAPSLTDKNARISAEWSDGGGEFVPGSEARLSRLRHILTPAQRNQSLQFKFAVNDDEASSGPLSFKDCDFAGSVGYPSDDFRHMIVNYNFAVGPTQGDSVSADPQPVPTPQLAGAILERAPLGSSGPDELAVQCERIHTEPGERRIILKMTTSSDQQVKVAAAGKTIIPMVLSRESYLPYIRQQFAFDFPAGSSVSDAKMDITVQSPKGDHSYQVTFQRCLNLVSSQDKELIISQEHALYFDEAGRLGDGGDLTCCLSNGTCQQMIVGLH
ncbi:hypothetical protein [Oligoflexus tunisiensis]|uniref:hypothetical protein n=1 Tax=Oligoflexus tunisiensis TaxID=708132 RepID=UPI00114D04BA|nr:hypothetical protein [Oligoflexus tunisiensis]